MRFKRCSLVSPILRTNSPVRDISAATNPAPRPRFCTARISKVIPHAIKYGSKSAKSSLQTQISFKILQKSYIFTFFK